MTKFLFLALFIPSLMLGGVQGNTGHSQYSVELIKSNSKFSLKDFQTKVTQGENTITLLRSSDIKYKSYLYFVFIFIFFVLVYIKLSSPEYLEDLFTGFYKKSYLLSGYSKQKYGIGVNNILLDIIFMAVLTIFFYELLWETYQIPFVYILGTLLLFVLLQVIVVFIFYYIFFGREYVNIHLSNVFTFNRILGIIFTPLIFIITYLDRDYRALALQILLVFLVSVLLFRLIRIYSQIKSLFNYSFLYIFLYICVFEISIYFVLFKLFLVNILN